MPRQPDYREAFEFREQCNDMMALSRLAGDIISRYGEHRFVNLQDYDWQSDHEPWSYELVSNLEGTFAINIFYGERDDLYDAYEFSDRDLDRIVVDEQEREMLVPVQDVNRADTVDLIQSLLLSAYPQYASMPLFEIQEGLRLRRQFYGVIGGIRLEVMSGVVSEDVVVWNAFRQVEWNGLGRDEKDFQPFYEVAFDRFGLCDSDLRTCMPRMFPSIFPGLIRYDNEGE